MAEIAAKFKRTGIRRSAIFGARKVLMEELYATGIPIYCDQSYYVNEQKVDLVEKVGEHFKCEVEAGIVIAVGADDGGEHIRTTCCCRQCGHLWHPRNFDYTIDK